MIMTTITVICIILLIILIAVSVAANIILGIALAVTTFYAYKFSKIILSIDDALEETFEILDEKYRLLCLLLEKPIFFDSPEIRAAIGDIKKSRDSILYVANVLALSIDPNAVIEEITEEAEKN